MKNRTVILIEEDEICRGLVRAQLRAEGYEVLLASRGLAAVQLAAIVQPDAILLGVEGDDDATLAALKVTSSTRALPVIALASGSASVTIGERGAAACLCKPFGIGGLGRFLEHELRATAAPRPGSIPPLALAG